MLLMNILGSFVPSQTRILLKRLISIIAGLDKIVCGRIIVVMDLHFIGTGLIISGAFLDNNLVENDVIGDHKTLFVL